MEAKRAGVQRPASHGRGPVCEGSRFGSLTCLGREPRGALWRCRCDCGAEIVVRESLLESGVCRSCGCKPARAKDLTGLRFGRLTALEPLPGRDADGSVRWRCACDCGAVVEVGSNKLLMGHTRSCGCYQVENRCGSRTFVDGTCLEIIASDKLPKNNTSGYKGVSRHRNQWAAYITYATKQYALGRFDDIRTAVALREGAERLRMEFVRRKISGQPSAQTFREALQEYLRRARGTPGLCAETEDLRNGRSPQRDDAPRIR